MNKTKIYVGNRDAGKTTFLYNLFEKARSSGLKILVIDSATDHVDKSLICRIKATYPEECYWFSSCDENQITFPYVDSATYPVELVKQNPSSIYLADVSYYLEKGYDYPEGERRKYLRLLYKKLSMQIIQALYEHIDIILMDEIELLPESREVFKLCADSNIPIYDTLHEKASTEGLEDMVTIRSIEHV